MASSPQYQRSSLPEPQYQLPLLISPLRHKTPSLPAMRHSPSLQTLNFHPLGFQPLNTFRANLPSRPYPETITEDKDPTPRPLTIKKLRKSPSMPLGGAAGRDSKVPQFARKLPPQSRSFLGLSFPPQPKPRSSSAGVLLANVGGKAAGVNTIRRASTQRENARKEMPGAGMAWLQRPRSTRPISSVPTSSTSAPDEALRDPTSTPASGYVTAQTHCSSKMPGSRNSSGDATAGSSFRSSSYQSVGLKLSTITSEADPDVSDEIVKGAFRLRRASSTAGVHGNKKKNILDFRNSHPPSTDQSADGSTEKAATKGWKEKVFSKDFFTRVGSSPKKEGKVKGRDRNNSTSSSNTLQLAHIPRPLTTAANSSPSSTRIEIPSNRSWCEGGFRYKGNDGGGWQLDGYGETLGTGYFSHSQKGTFNDSVLGIFEGSQGDRGRTRLKQASHWKSPVLRLQMEVVAETEKIPISYPGVSGGEKVIWVSVELDGKVDSGTESFEGSKVGLDVGILMDLSAYTSSSSLASMKLQAKRIVEAMETSRDRVAVMTFPAESTTGSQHVKPDTVHVLNSSGSVAKRQLMDDIASLGQNKWGIDPASRNVRAAVQASVRKLKGMPLDTARYGTHRHAHLFLLTSKLDNGEIELLPEVFFGEIQLHIIGIGVLFWPRNEMGASGWCIPTGTLGPRPTLSKRIVQQPEDALAKTKTETADIDEIIRLLRTAVDLGALHQLVIELDAGENCSIRAVMGDLRYEKLLPGEKRTLLVQIQVGDMPIPDISNQYDLDGNHETMPRWVILERQLEATLGELKGRLLTVRAKYYHANFPETVTFVTERKVDISRFAEDSLWRFSPTGNKLVDKEESPPTSPVLAEDYVKKVLIQRVASMHSSPSRALKAVQEISSGAKSRGIDLLEISTELTYRQKVEQKFKEASRSSEGVGPTIVARPIEVDNSPPRSRKSWDSSTTPTQTFSEQRTSIPVETITTPINRDCRYRGSRELHNEDRAPFIATMDTSPDTERPDIDLDDEAQRIWLEIKLRQRGVSSGSIKRRSLRSKRGDSMYVRPKLDDRLDDLDDRRDMLSTVYSSISASGEESEDESKEIDGMSKLGGKRGSSGQDTLKSMITLRDVHETDFGPWAM